MNMHTTGAECPLNPIELETVRWLAQGKAINEIAQIIGCNRVTAGRRVHRAYGKTDTYNYHGLVGLALRKGWLQ